MAEERFAEIYIRNETGKDISGLVLEHIYSSREPDIRKAKVIHQNEEVMIGLANYEVGFGTGLDWWKLLWSDDENTVYTSDKSLLSKIGSYFARYGMDLLSIASSAINLWSLVENKEKWVNGIVNLISVVFNFGVRDTVSTMDRLKEYKEFMLEKQDESICFTIHSDRLITIITSSGSSGSFEYYKQRVVPENVVAQLDNVPANTEVTA